LELVNTLCWAGKSNPSRTVHCSTAPVRVRQRQGHKHWEQRNALRACFLQLP